MSILRRLWPRRKPAAGATMAVQVHSVLVPRPIPLAERKPGNSDYRGDLIWWGFWDVSTWLWDLQEHPGLEHTHWLPATVEVLPARCCPPDDQ